MRHDPILFPLVYIEAYPCLGFIRLVFLYLPLCATCSNSPTFTSILRLSKLPILYFMGSISPLSSPFTNYRIYTSFCSNDLLATSNMSNWIECYDPATNSWHRVDRVPELLENHVRKDFSMVSIGDFVYIIGGRLCHKVLGDGPYEIVEVGLEILSSVIRYDVRNGVWSKCAPLGVPRFDFACAVCDGKIYVAGGQCTLGVARGTSSAEMYDPILDEWKPLPDMR
ncbi:hypothetical protein V6N13_134828 [Hibiscus sabdariffa]|uniref:Uncharacterized protein n=1 Tax=Hibiscus sabdariffa TaxID=183260 RepID=A0ABR2R4X8_9ROSI